MQENRTVKKNKNQAIGRSSGGLTTKIHTICDALGNPVSFCLTGGQEHDLVGADTLLENFSFGALLADKAYDADERVVQKLKAKGCEVVIPSRKSNLKPRSYDKHLYKSRHLIENFFAKLKNFRGIATRYDKTAESFLSGVYLASTVISLK